MSGICRVLSAESRPHAAPLQEQQGEGCHVFGFLRVNKVPAAAQIHEM